MDTMTLWALYEKAGDGSPWLLEVSSDMSRLREVLNDGDHSGCWIEEQKWERIG